MYFQLKPFQVEIPEDEGNRGVMMQATRDAETKTKLAETRRRTAARLTAAKEHDASRDVPTALRRIIRATDLPRSEEHTSELQSLMRHSSPVFFFQKKTQENSNTTKQ